MVHTPTTVMTKQQFLFNKEKKVGHGFTRSTCPNYVAREYGH